MFVLWQLSCNTCGYHYSTETNKNYVGSGITKIFPYQEDIGSKNLLFYDIDVLYEILF
jgi:hypothetical protein